MAARQHDTSSPVRSAPLASCPAYPRYSPSVPPVRIDPLDREASRHVVGWSSDTSHLLEMVQQRRPVVPRHALGALDDVVAAQRRDRDVQAVVRRPASARNGAKLGDDLVEALLAVVDEVHLVDGDDDVGDPEQRADERVALGLLEHALARVEQDHREVGGRGAGDHVARVLLVAGAVGDDEAPSRAS